jgi:cytochrome c5
MARVPAWLWGFAMGLMVTGCGAPKVSPAEAAAKAAAMTPADARLAGLYDTACKACHTVATAGAPLTGDRAAWAPRVKQGMPVLLTHVVQGFKAMPAGGQCAACTADDFKALVAFMADQQVPS